MAVSDRDVRRSVTMFLYIRLSNIPGGGDGGGIAGEIVILSLSLSSIIGPCGFV